MNQSPLRRSLTALVALALLVTVGNRANAADKSETLTIFVAASTQDDVKKVATAFTDETKIEVKISAGPSNALANQIINGADADLFLSANSEWADKVRDEHQAVKTEPLLTNDLVLVVPKGNPAGIKQLTDLLDKKVEHVALAGEKVPAGIYAQQALKAAGIYDRLVEEKKIVRGQDVRFTLTFVERGEAAAGVVYGSDTLVSDKVEVALKFDPATYEKIVYPLVLLKHGEKNAAAAKFFDFLRSPTAVEIFQAGGFRMLK
jgi:molybdate transport system substrate-binding protein